ncbi:hypothetical protein MMC07_000132 [Pseudocyphellaria aurata]|nr:hypothetical protein [Pseudocyphellaria aurata]
MPSRLRLCSRCLYSVTQRGLLPPSSLRRFLSTAPAAISSPPPQFSQDLSPSIAHYPPTQPPSHRPPELRTSQLHRQYTSLLRSSPLMLIFQYNNLKSSEWMVVRHELIKNLRKVDASLPPSSPPLADSIKIHVINTQIFKAALLVTEFFRPEQLALSPDTLTHSLSRAAHDAVASKKNSHPLTPLLSGPLAVVSFPLVSPLHLKSVLSILAPHPPTFAAPTRRANPGYYDPMTQSGLHKLLLLGARVEGKVFDTDGIRWIGGIEGGMEGLRAQLVAMLTGIGAGVTGALESTSRSLYFTLEGRRDMLDDEAKGPAEEKRAE